MATKNFTQFNTATPLTTSDYIIGYNAAGTAEIKTQVQSILNLKNDSDAQTLSFNEGNKNLTISSGNTVSLSALAGNGGSSNSTSLVDELTSLSPETISFIRETLSAAETFRLEAPKSDNRSIDNYGDTTVTFLSSEGEGPEGTLGRLTVTFPPTDEHYARQLLRRLRIKYDQNNNDFRYNYSNVKVTINPGEGEIVSNVLGMEWSSNNDVYDIYVDQAPTSDPFTVSSIDFDYKFVNTVGLDVPNDVFGIATDDDDIDIVSGRDINLQAADDVYISAGDEFELVNNRLDNQNEDEGIRIITNNDGNQYTWTFDFQGKLRLPGDSGLQIAPEEDYGVRIGTGDLSTAPSSHIKVGGNSAFEIFGGPPGYSYKFDKKNTLTLPPSGTLSADGGDFNSGYLQWLGGASGDGYGYTTLELHPDSTRSEFDQYIIIDPTAGEPPHIHIRAGGTQDSSGAVLFLGGENSHVKVGAGANPPITIASDNNNFIFNPDGYLIFPDGGSLKYRNTVPTSSVGAPGDVEGTVVIASGYIYYCTANYGGTQYNAQSVLPGDGDQSGYLVPNSYQLPQVGWKVYYNGQERTIVQVNDGGNPGYYTVFVNSALQIPADTTFQWGPAPVENIWKRVAFSNDTW